MRIDHIALWTTDLERCKQFHARYFGAAAGADYVNPRKGFSVALDPDGNRVEIMACEENR